MLGPRAASTSAGSLPPAASAPSAAVATPDAVPRQPACAAATARRRGSTSSSGRQSAVSMPRMRPGLGGDRGVAFRPALPRGPRHRHAVHLVEEEQASAIGERVGHARREPSRVSQPAGPSRCSNPWTRPGDGVERGHGGDAEGGVHRPIVTGRRGRRRTRLVEDAGRRAGRGHGEVAIADADDPALARRLHGRGARLRGVQERSQPAAGRAAGREEGRAAALGGALGLADVEVVRGDSAGRRGSSCPSGRAPGFSRWAASGRW